MKSDNYIDPDALWEWLFSNLKEKIKNFNQETRTIQVRFYSRLFSLAVEPQDLTPSMIAFISKPVKERLTIPKGVLVHQYYQTDQRLVFVSMHGNKKITITFPIEDYYRTRVRGRQFRSWINRMFNQLKEWEDKNRGKKKLKTSKKPKKLNKSKKIFPIRLDGFLQH